MGPQARPFRDGAKSAYSPARWLIGAVLLCQLLCGVAGMGLTLPPVPSLPQTELLSFVPTGQAKAIRLADLLAVAACESRRGTAAGLLPRTGADFPTLMAVRHAAVRRYWGSLLRTRLGRHQRIATGEEPAEVA